MKQKVVQKWVLVVGNAEELCRALRKLGGIPIQKPLVETDPPVIDYGLPLDAKNRRM